RTTSTIWASMTLRWPCSSANRSNSAPIRASCPSRGSVVVAMQRSLHDPSDRNSGRIYRRTMTRTDTASRLIAAPVEQVFAALIDQDALTAWLPPDGMTGRFEHFDPTPGGSYVLTLTYDDPTGAPGKATADSDIVEARYVD